MHKKTRRSNMMYLITTKNSIYALYQKRKWLGMRGDGWYLQELTTKREFLFISIVSPNDDGSSVLGSERSIAYLQEEVMRKISSNSNKDKALLFLKPEQSQQKDLQRTLASQVPETSAFMKDKGITKIVPFNDTLENYQYLMVQDQLANFDLGIYPVKATTIGSVPVAVMIDREPKIILTLLDHKGYTSIEDIRRTILYIWGGMNPETKNYPLKECVSAGLIQLKRDMYCNNPPFDAVLIRREDAMELWDKSINSGKSSGSRTISLTDYMHHITITRFVRLK